MPSLARFCDHCHHYGCIEVTEGKMLICPHCQSSWGNMERVGDVFDRCPVCACRQFYKDKDFNQVLGFIVMACGIVLVPWTYGLSLPVFAVFDWFLYRKVPWMVACYRCGTEFRGFPTPKHLKPFKHHLGLHYDKYR